MRSTWPTYGCTLGRESWYEHSWLSDLKPHTLLHRDEEAAISQLQTPLGPPKLLPQVATCLPGGSSFPLTNFQLPGLFLLFPQMFQSLVEFPLEEIKTS